MASNDFSDPLVLQSHLSATFAPISLPTCVSGGYANHTFRATVLSTNESIIIKYSSRVGVHVDIELDPIRSFHENAVLRVPPHTFTVNGITIKPVTPKYYDEQNHIQILEDAGADSGTLKSLLLSSNAVPAGIGAALGAFLRGVHSLPVKVGEGNTALARRLWDWATYGRLMETVQMFPDVLTRRSEVFEEVVAVGRRETVLLHGDYWTGNVLLLGDTATVADWEMVRVGERWEDLGQMCAELYLPSERGYSLIDEFLKGYGDFDEETARMAVVHCGVHLVVWPCMIPGLWEPEVVKQAIASGAEFVERGWKKDWEWVKTSVLRGFVKEKWVSE